MPFLSLEFGLFFLVFFPLYWAIARFPNWQNSLLFFSGLGWLWYISPFFAFAVIAFSLIISLLARFIYQAKTQLHKKIGLSTAIIVAILNLSFFKYFDFFRNSIQAVLNLSDLFVDIVIPLGISYYTFQSISYVVSVYRKSVIYLSLSHTLLYFCFFPTITSGPIIRANSFKSINGVERGMVEQLILQSPRKIIKPALAISLILLGIIKKWWWAGALAEDVVDPIFNNPMQYDAFHILVAIYGYTAQLFFDFSGYSDLVIGMAMLLGFQLPMNFMMPLRSKNLQEFWQRWHITLSTWIRDYIYIPIGGNKKGFWLTQCNIMIAMVLSGVWHGAGWNFTIWGGLHGLGLILLNIKNRIFRKSVSSSSIFVKIIAIAITLTFVSFTFIVFRVANLEEVELILKALLNPIQSYPSGRVLFSAGILLFSLCCYAWFKSLFEGFVKFLEYLPVWLWVFPILVVLILVMIMAPSGIPSFIYANF